MFHFDVAHFQNQMQMFIRSIYGTVLAAADTGEILTLTLVLMTTVCVFMARETSIKKTRKPKQKIHLFRELVHITLYFTNFLA